MVRQKDEVVFASPERVQRNYRWLYPLFWLTAVMSGVISVGAGIELLKHPSQPTLWLTTVVFAAMALFYHFLLKQAKATPSLRLTADGLVFSSLGMLHWDEIRSVEAQGKLLVIRFHDYGAVRRRLGRRLWFLPLSPPRDGFSIDTSIYGVAADEAAAAITDIRPNEP